jgi:hypothetical protein
MREGFAEALVALDYRRIKNASPLLLGYSVQCPFQPLLSFDYRA